jgi:mono/diheme cytochrome c family protein
MEFAPDGSLYLVDWHNILIGHMQHNARDPLRDHVHGRIYRITYPSRPLVTPAKIDGASIETLLSNLTLPEYRSRYRTRRELRARNADEVLAKMDKWILSLDTKDANYEHHLLEGLWVSWGLNKVNQPLLKKLLSANDYRVRAAAVEVLRFNEHQVKNQAEWLKQAASDDHPRVRLGAIVAASWLEKAKGMMVLEAAKMKTLDEWMVYAYETAVAHLNGVAVIKPKVVKKVETNLKGDDLALFSKGKEVYGKEGYCVTCHQADGNGLTASGFPPLSGTEWVTGDQVRLVKVILKGLMGPIEVNGKQYEGMVPMTPFEGLSDDDVAAVATYIRNSFGNTASPIQPSFVKEVRATLSKKQSFYQSTKLLKMHPLESKMTKKG